MALNETAARQALEDAIMEAARATGLFADAALVFPNIFKDTGDATRLEVDHIDSDPEADLDGTIFSERGVYQATVVTAKNRGAGEGRVAAKALKDQMPLGRTFAVPGGGLVQIINNPNVQAGFEDDTSWRTPLVIQYLASG